MPEKSELQEKLNEALSQQIKLQQHLIDAQNEIIALRKKIDELTPKTPNDDVHWNFVSGGLTAEDVLAEGDAAKLKSLYEWVFLFGEKYVKPHVHQKTYAELLAHMTRGLARRMAEVDVSAEFGNDVLPEGKTVPFPDGGVLTKSNVQDTKPTRKTTKRTTAKKKNTPQQKKLLDD